MSSVLDSFPYPYHEPQAQQLHLILSQLHSTSDGAILVAEQAGLDRGLIHSGQPPFFIWKNILDLSGTSGLTRHLVQIVHDRLTVNHPRRAFLEGLLKNQTVAADSEPRGADGSPNFFRGNDDISEPEALLYFDDLTVQVGRLPGLIQTLQRMIQLARSVCRLTVDIRGRTQYGTGFHIGDDLLLTNWHVVNFSQSGESATAITAEFGYEQDGDGIALAPTLIPCDVKSIVMDEGDDWAVMRVHLPLKDDWPPTKLSEAIAPTKGSVAYIIQHPGADRKRIGFVRNNVTFFDGRVVQYLTDTQEGSSGAPVFDAQGQLLALHHAGGRPQQLFGKAPVKKNEGIRISRILEGLAKKGITVP